MSPTLLSRQDTGLEKSLVQIQSPNQDTRKEEATEPVVELRNLEPSPLVWPRNTTQEDGLGG